MKRALCVVIGFVVFALVALARSQHLAIALPVAAAYLIPLGISLLLVPGWGGLAFVAIYAAIMGIWGPGDGAEGLSWPMIWFILMFTSIVTLLWAGLDKLRKRRRKTEQPA